MASEPKTNEMYENIFDRCCLIQLSTSAWGGVKRIDKKTAQKKLGTDWARAQKYLVEPTVLKPYNSIRNSARAYLQSVSVPFVIDGIYMISYDSLKRVNAKLEDFQELASDAKFDIIAGYPSFRRKAELILGPELFSSDDYPEDIGPYFNFEWRIFTMSAPGENQYVTPEMVEREQRKFIDTMKEARNNVLYALRKEMNDMVSKMVERLTDNDDGSRKSFHETTVSKNFLEYFENFQSRNIFQDDQLAAIVKKAKKIIEGVDVETLKNNDKVRETVRTEMSAVADLLTECIKDAPTRKLKI